MKKHGIITTSLGAERSRGQSFANPTLFNSSIALISAFRAC